MKKTVWIVIPLLIAAGLVAVRVHRVHEKNDAPLAVGIPPSVRVATVSHGRAARTLHVLGTVVGADEAAIAPRIMAQILEVRVREADRVDKGQVLARLDPQELEDSVAEAEAGLEGAREGLAAAGVAFDAQHEASARDARLFEAKAISQEQWDRSRAADAAAAAHRSAAEAAFVVAERRLDQARARLGYCRLEAPFDGVVAARLADPGDLAVPGKAVFELVRKKGVRIRAEVPPEDLVLLEEGQAVTSTFADRVVKTTISRVFPAMGRSHLAAFEADLPDPPPGFVSGATVGVDLELEPAEGLRVPAEALLQGEEQTHVFVVENGVVHPIRVEVVAQSAGGAVVRGEISAGDQVVVARPSRLMTFTEGSEVRVAATEG
jgi:RND family efflux transporter MFP subunit